MSELQIPQKKHQWKGCTCCILARSEIFGAVFARAQCKSSSATNLLL